jgi:REP element-mobilizing transposase RayT
MAGVLQDLDSPAITINSVADHVHILFTLDKDRALSNVVMQVKRSSSKWIKTQGNVFRRFHWQSGYGGFSVGESAVEKVTAYIGRQAKHHQKTTFQDELRKLLTRYKIEYDERYLWD